MHLIACEFTHMIKANRNSHVCNYRGSARRRFDESLAGGVAIPFGASPDYESTRSFPSDSRSCTILYALDLPDMTYMLAKSEEVCNHGK